MKCENCVNNVSENGGKICSVVGVEINKISDFESEKCMIFKEKGTTLIEKLKDMDVDRFALHFVYKIKGKYKSVLIENGIFNSIADAVDATKNKLLEVVQ